MPVRVLDRTALVGYAAVVAAGDHAQVGAELAYVEVLADEQQGTAIGLLSRALAWFNGHGFECRQVTSDNVPDYISRLFN